MFDYISGELIEKRSSEVVVEVEGIGYVLQVPVSTMETLPDTGSEAKLFVHQYVREDAFDLFGFRNQEERQFFRVLMNVSGIGPRIAVAALSALKPRVIQEAILNEETGILTQISGIGKKTAERLIVELKDKVADLDLGGPPVHAATSEEDSSQSSLRTDARKALISLGLSKAKAERSLRKALRQQSEYQTVEDLIRVALRQE